MIIFDRSLLCPCRKGNRGVQIDWESGWVIGMGDHPAPGNDGDTYSSLSAWSALSQWRDKSAQYVRCHRNSQRDRRSPAYQRELIVTEMKNWANQVTASGLPPQ